jgi:hypothetical protein
MRLATSVPNSKLKLTAHVQLVQMSRKYGSMQPLLHTPSWRSVQLVKHRNKVLVYSFITPLNVICFSKYMGIYSLLTVSRIYQWFFCPDPANSSWLSDSADVAVCSLGSREYIAGKNMFRVSLFFLVVSVMVTPHFFSLEVFIAHYFLTVSFMFTQKLIRFLYTHTLNTFFL